MTGAEFWGTEWTAGDVLFLLAAGIAPYLVEEQSSPQAGEQNT